MSNSERERALPSNAEQIDIGEAAVEHGDQRRRHAIGVVAAKGVEAATAISRFKDWQEKRREEKWKKRAAAYKEARRTLYGPIADYVSFGLRGARPGTMINVPLVLPATRTQVAYEERMRQQLMTPDGQKQHDDLIESLTQKDEEERRSWEQQDQGDKVL
jgi:hypothetical protein